jgi:site-specific DNA recombinase
MVADALAGKIDLIVTKSVSRFARNTVDSLTTVRKLKEKGVEIYFEKENIWTLDSKGELLITIMSSLAQEESRSISENCTWGQRKRFADGKVTVPFNRFLGYDRGEDGNLLINPEQAATVKRIYSMFLQGMTPFGIATKLTADGVFSPGGKPKWNAGAVRSILTNEKYRGDALLQKSYTVDFLTKKKKVNEGEIPQYYVENNHPAIIAPEVFEMVQRELERRGQSRGRHSGVHLFSGRIKCGQCGSSYGSKVWHSTDKYRRTIWRCNHKFDSDENCTTPHLTDDEIKQYFVSAVNKLLTGKEEIIAGFAAIKDTVFDTSALTAERDELQSEMLVVSELMQQCIYENSHVALDQAEYQKRYDGLTERFDKAKARLDSVTEEISDKQTRKATIEAFLDDLKQQDGLVTEFAPTLWYSLVDFVTVYSKDDVRVTFKDGTEIQA